MTSAQAFQLAVGTAIGFSALPALLWLGRRFFVQVEDEQAVLVTYFGKLERTLREPGLHWLPAAVLPWVHTLAVSLQRDFRVVENVHVNDARGTTVTIDLWVEFRISDPARAMFEIADWD